MNRIRKISVGKRKPQATNGHLFGKLEQCVLTSAFSTPVTLGQFPYCTGLPFSHLLNVEDGVTPMLLISSVWGLNEDTGV